MDDVEVAVVCFGSRNCNAKHVLVVGLTKDQEDELYEALDVLYGERLLTDCMNTCEFWVPDFPLDEVRNAVEVKLGELSVRFISKESEFQ